MGPGRPSTEHPAGRGPLRPHGQGRRILEKWDLILPPGLYAGIKLFVIDFIFKRCPRLRAKYDTPYIIWKSLPTDPQLKERSSTAVSRRVGPAAAGRCAGHTLLSLTSGLRGGWCL